MSTKKKNKSLVKKTRKNRFKNKLSTHIMKGGASYELKIGNDPPLISYDSDSKTFKFTGTNGKPKIEKIVFQKQLGYYAQFKILNIFFASVTPGQENDIDTFLAQHEYIYNNIIIPDKPAVSQSYVSREINTYLTQTLTSKCQCKCNVVGSYVQDSYVVKDVKEEVIYEFTLDPTQFIEIQVSTTDF